MTSPHLLGQHYNHNGKDEDEDDGAVFNTHTNSTRQRFVTSLDGIEDYILYSEWHYQQRLMLIDLTRLHRRSSASRLLP